MFYSSNEQGFDMKKYTRIQLIVKELCLTHEQNHVYKRENLSIICDCAKLPIAQTIAREMLNLQTNFPAQYFPGRSKMPWDVAKQIRNSSL